MSKIDFGDTPFNDYLKTARISGDTLYAVLQPKWEGMAKEKQQEVLQGIYKAGSDKGYINVTLLNSKGKIVGFASPARVELNTP